MTDAAEVKFAKYSSMKYATARKLDLLRDKWTGAYQALLAGGTSDSYVRGLYVGHGNDYATAPMDNTTGTDGKTIPGYRPAMRYRLKQVVANFIMVAKDDLKEIGQQAASVPGTPPASGTSLDYRTNLVLNKDRSGAEKLQAALNDLQTRVNAGKPVQA